MSWPSCFRLLVADVCIHVEVRAEAFLPWSELEQWSYGDAALAVFVGRVRVEGQNGISIDALEIEHYPGMCEARITNGSRRLPWQAMVLTLFWFCIGWAG